MHLLSERAPAAETASARAPIPSVADDRIVYLEHEVEELRRELTEVQQQLAVFRKQFE
jgi:hypothetical protein